MIRMSGLNPDGACNLGSVEFERDHVHRLDAFARGHLRADLDGVVPRQLRERFWQFLQPAVVSELAVVDGGIAADVYFEAPCVGVVGGSGRGDRVCSW